jgi:hypothetical protein
MKSGVCPKCQSEEVYVTPNYFTDCGKLVIHFFAKLNLERYLCINCGFTEEYVMVKDFQDSYNREELRKSFHKVKN